MAAPVLSSNSPSSGFISWTPFSMSYLGQSFDFAADSTNSRYVYWRYNNGLGSGLLSTNDPNVIATLTDDDCLLFLNRTGFAINALTVDMLYGDLIVPGTILTDQLAAHAVQASNITLNALPDLVPNGSFNELDKVNPTMPAYWTAGSGSGVRSMESVQVKAPGGYSVKMTQTIGSNILTSGEFAANVTGWTATGATATWQSGWSASGQMKVAIAAAASAPTITSPTFPVTAGTSYNLIVAMEADGTGASPTSPVAVNEQIQWLNSTGAVISTSSYVNQAEIAVSTAVDDFSSPLQQNFVAPGGAVNARVVLTMASDPTQASLHYIDYVRVTASSYCEMWSDAVPVSAGEWIRFTFWAKADVTTVDTLISAAHFHGSDPLFTPTTAQMSLDPVTGSSTIDTSADLGFNTTWTKYTGTIQIPAGMNFMRIVLGTEPGTYQTVGTYNVYFDEADVQDIASGNIQSSDYVPGVSGWALLDAGQTSQVENLNVISALGADTISANTYQVGTLDLVNDVLNTYSTGLIAYGEPDYSTDTGNIGATENVVFRMNLGSMSAGRNYRISIGGTVKGAGTVAGDVYTMRLRYTTDGSQPTSASGIMNHSVIRVVVENASYGPTFNKVFHYQAAQDFDAVVLGFSVQRTSGTGTVAILASDANYGFFISVEDIGARTNVGGTMTQASKLTGTGDTSTPKATHTKTFYPNQSRSYDSDGTRRTGDTANPDMYQGYYSSTHGNTMSCAVYDWATIQSTLANASNILVKLTFRVKHAYQGAGLNVSVHQHTYSGSTTPSVYRAGAEIATKAGCKEGSTYTIGLPASFATALQNGSAKGIGFGKPGTTSNSWFGYLYGSGSGSAPALTITYTK